MPLRSWIGEEPIRVSPDTPNEAYEQKRVTITNPWSSATVKYVGPPNGYYWIVDSIQIEASASIVEIVPARDVYIYAKDKDQRTARYRLTRLLKSEAGVFLGNYGCSYADRGASTASGCFPLYMPVVNYPAEYGMMISQVDTGDVYTMHLFVRQYKVV